MATIAIYEDLAQHPIDILQNLAIRYKQSNRLELGWTAP
jgi:hypothetical protein